MSVIKEFVFALGWQVDNSKLTAAEKKARKSAKATADSWRKAGKDIGKSLAVVGAAAAGAAVALFKMAETSATAGDRVAKMAKQTGVATRDYQRMTFAIQRSGGSVGGFDKAVRTMTVNLENAVQKGTGPLADGLGSIGMSAEDLIGVPLEERLSLIADALEQVSDKGKRSAITMQIFGSKGGAELVTLLAEGRGGIKSLGDEAERLGEVLGEDALKAAEAFTDSVLDVKIVLKSLARDVGLAIMPTIKLAMEGVKEWAIANRELIATKVEEVIRSVMKAVEQLVPSMLELLPILAELVQIGAQIGGTLGPGGATTAMIGFRSAMSGALGPAGMLAVAVATVASALVNMVAKAQAAKLALNDFFQGGRGKRGEGTKFLVSKREGDLQAERRQRLARAEELSGIEGNHAALSEGEAFPTSQKGVIALSNKARSMRLAALSRVAAIDSEIKAERARFSQASKDRDAKEAALMGPFLKDAGSDRVEAVDKKKDGGTGKKSKGRSGAKAVDVSAADTLFGEQLRKLASDNGVGAIAIRSSLEAGQTSLSSGAADSVARKAALSRLGSLAGKDFTSSKSQSKGDPLMSSIFGDENVPDIELSAIARGANPQTLISHITNNVTLGDNNFSIEGAGNPGDVASEAVRRFDERLAEVFSKASKTATPPFLR